MDKMTIACQHTVAPGYEDYSTSRTKWSMADGGRSTKSSKDTNRRLTTHLCHLGGRKELMNEVSVYSGVEGRYAAVLLPELSTFLSPVNPM